MEEMIEVVLSPAVLCDKEDKRIVLAATDYVIVALHLQPGTLDEAAEKLKKMGLSLGTLEDLHKIDHIAADELWQKQLLSNVVAVENGVAYVRRLNPVHRRIFDKLIFKDENILLLNMDALIAVEAS